MKLYLIAGEPSGDLHGSNLIRALRALRPEVEVRCWGGDLMAEAGGTVVKHYRDLAFMGFVEVVRNLRTILGNLAFCKQDILDFQPDAVVFIDYPGFNLRVARWAKSVGLRTVYYISPQIWAWHQSRVHAIRRDVDQMLVILPFEVEFYHKHDVEVEFVGHPLLDAISTNAEFGIGGMRNERDASGIPYSANSEFRIALLPGSRRQEVGRILPQMLSVVDDFPEYEFVVAGSAGLPASVYEEHLAGKPRVTLVQGQTYEVLRSSRAALVKSGTSTLETALLDVPQVVCYAGNAVSYAIARRLVQVKYISLVNLIADAPLVEELIQNELNHNNLQRALARVLEPVHAAQLRADYAELRKKLGEEGASRRAAQAILAGLT